MLGSDTQRLFDRFRAYCVEHDLSAERAAGLVGLAKATVQQLLNGATENPRTITISRIRAFMGRVAAPELSDADFFRFMAGRMRLSGEQVARTLEIYAGIYIGWRLTPTNRSVLASKIVVRALSDDDPLPFFFEEIEVCEEPALGETARHRFQHSGPVLYREGRLYFVSLASGNVREMIFTAPLSPEFSVLRGLVLTVSAAREPYCTRILLRRESAEPPAGTTGTYALDDPAVAGVVADVANRLASDLDPLKVK